MSGHFRLVWMFQHNKIIHKHYVCYILNLTCCGLARAMSPGGPLMFTPGPLMFNSWALERLSSLLLDRFNSLTPGRLSSLAPGRFNSLGPERFWKLSLVPEMLSSLAAGRFWKLMLSFTSSNLTRRLSKSTLIHLWPKMLWPHTHLAIKAEMPKWRQISRRGSISRWVIVATCVKNDFMLWYLWWMISLSGDIQRKESKELESLIWVIPRQCRRTAGASWQRWNKFSCLHKQLFSLSIFWATTDWKSFYNTSRIFPE